MAREVIITHICCNACNKKAGGIVFLHSRPPRTRIGERTYQRRTSTKARRQSSVQAYKLYQRQSGLRQVHIEKERVQLHNRSRAKRVQWSSVLRPAAGDLGCPQYLSILHVGERGCRGLPAGGLGVSPKLSISNISHEHEPGKEKAKEE